MSKTSPSTHFTHIRDTPLEEFSGVGRRFRHNETGCDIYHLHNDDPENLFAFMFKTVPPDSTGVAHILEHTVLCGSERYPVKDPFLLLLKGSMYTFLNALTFPDKTVYPASSTVPADLFNLMKVYGDAVFFPLLKEEMFRQEGHRLIVSDEGTLDYSGVVYNEMKGAYSTHDAIAGEMALRSLFPDTAYGHDSGGNPREITKLTYEDFLDFHRRYYHPSNARIFLYGSIDTDEYLTFLHAEFLSRFRGAPDKNAASGERAGSDGSSASGQPPGHDPAATVRSAAGSGGAVASDITVDLQPRWSEPRAVHASYPTDQEDTAGLASVTVNWLLTDIGSPVRVLACEALGDILLGGSGAPLYKALIESGLGEDLSAPSGLETELREITFSTGLRGTDPEKQQAIEDLVLTTLRSLRDDGIDPDVVEGTLRKMAFSHRERSGSGFGLRLMRRAARAWLHGGEPEETMCFVGHFAVLRDAVRADPRYFEALIEELLLNNPHRTTLVVTPDRDYERREREAVREELSAIEKRLSDSERDELRRRDERLLALQSEPDPPDAVAAIPFLTIDDVPAEVECIPYELETLPGGGPLLVHELDTGGIIYFDLSFDMTGIGEDLLPYAPLFANTITDIGLPEMSYDAVARKLDLTTGGFTAGVGSTGRVESGKPVTALTVRVKALAETAEEGFGLAFDLLRRADFGDHRRIRDLLLEERNDMKSAVLPEGSSFAWTRAASRLSPAAAIRDRFRGIEQLRSITAIDPDESVSQIAGAFERLREQLFVAPAVSAAVAADPELLEAGRGYMGHFVASLGEGANDEATSAGGTDREGANVRNTASGRPDASTRGEDAAPIEGLSVPAGVGYVARVLNGARLGDEEYAHEGVLAHLLRTGYLWERIRMQGGAYGAFALQNGAESLFAMASYRDPRIVETLEAFEGALAHYAEMPPAPRDVELAVLGMVGSETRPLSPSQKNAISLRRFLTGVSDELRQQRRDVLRRTTAEDVARAGERLVSNMRSRSSTCVIAARDALEHAAERLPALSGSISDLPV